MVAFPLIPWVQETSIIPMPMSDAAIVWPPALGTIGEKLKLDSALTTNPRVAVADGMDKRTGTTTLTCAPDLPGTIGPKCAVPVVLCRAERTRWPKLGDADVMPQAAIRHGIHRCAMFDMV